MPSLKSPSLCNYLKHGHGNKKKKKRKKKFIHFIFIHHWIRIKGLVKGLNPQNSSFSAVDPRCQLRNHNPYMFVFARHAKRRHSALHKRSLHTHHINSYSCSPIARFSFLTKTDPLIKCIPCISCFCPLH